MAESPRAITLDVAKSLITADRNNQYGPPTQDFSRTARMLTAQGFVFVDANGNVHDLVPHHVAVIMITLKLSRIAWEPKKFDSWVDLAGYAGCGWECVETGEGTLY